MISPSSAFNTAYRNGNPQRMVFSFTNGTIVMNEDIDINAGVEFREIFCSETDLTIGLCPSSEISFTLLNDDGFYTNFTFGEFRAYLGVRTAVSANSSAVTRRPTVTLDTENETMTVTGNKKSETYAIIPMGTFIALRPSIVDKVEIAVTANDLMTQFDRDMPSSRQLGITYPVSASALLQAMCNYVNVTASTYSFLNSNLTLSTDPSESGDKSMRDVLGWIAEIACANARFNREGQLQFVWLNRLNKSFNESKYSQYESAWYTAGTITQLHTRNADSTAESVLGSGSQPYMIQDNPFLRIDDTPIVSS